MLDLRLPQGVQHSGQGAQVGAHLRDVPVRVVHRRRLRHSDRVRDERLAETGRTYDGIAAEYAAGSTTSTEVAAFRDRSADRMCGTVADLGCGPGQHAEALAARGLGVVGLDVSVAMLRLAAARGVPVVRGDLRRPPGWQVDDVGTRQSHRTWLTVLASAR